MPRSAKSTSKAQILRLQGAIQPAFSDLWLPLEAQIQRLSSNDAWPAALARQDGARRKLVQQLFASREEGNAAAQEAVEAFSTVLRLYVEETGRHEQSGASSEQAQQNAMAALSQDATFLQKAIAYNGAFQTWLIDLLERGELGELEADQTPIDGPAAAQSLARAQDYVVQTSQESAILLMSICDGKLGTQWHSDGQAGTRTYERRGLPHLVRLQLSEEERLAGLNPLALEAMTRELDADGTFAVLYVSRLLAPLSPLPSNALAADWVDLNDIIRKIGWDPRSAAERAQMRRKIWNYLKFCARANILGQRNGTYREGGREVSTRIEGPIWRFMKEEKPVEPSLLDDDDVPLRVQIAVSAEWTRLTTSPLLAQFLPMGELLGAIPPDKPSGAWARCLGLALSSFWRRNPRAALEGTLQPTRRELLEAYAPKAAPPEEILASRNPRRALEYWHGALQILTDSGFLARQGEAALTLEQINANLPRKNWISQWYEGPVGLFPGPKMAEAVRQCAQNLPVEKPKNLRANARAKTRRKKNI